MINSETYKQVPFKVEILSQIEGGNLNLNIELVDDKKFKLSFEESQEEKTNLFSFGEVFVFKGVQIRIDALKSSDLLNNSGGEFMYSFKSANDVAKTYSNRLSASWAEEGAGVINLSITGPNPQKELDFLNNLIENYQQYDLEKKNAAALNTISFIDEQLSGITDSLRKAEIQLERFKNQNAVIDLTGEASRLFQKIEGLELQKTELALKQKYYDHLNKYLSESKEYDKVILPSSVGITDNILSTLISRIIAIQTEIKIMTRTEKLQNPLLSSKLKELEEVRANILESVENQKSTENIRLEYLSNSIKDIEKQLNYLPIAERRLVNIRRNYSLQENLYVFLLQKRAEVGISKASNTSDISFVNPPSRGSIVSPDTRKNYILGLSIGLVFPIMFFVVAELLNNRIQSQEDIQKVTTIPLLGGIGHKRINENLEVFSKPKSAISESFRALRSNLNYFLQGKQQGVFLITSSISGEGKTFTSINLASVFALSGKRTLIVGADMRKPKIYADFDLDNRVGLSNYLAGLADFDSVIQKTRFENLDLISGGPVPPNPSELIIGKRMEEFITTAKKHYDYILIDSPPIGIVTDAFVLSSFADHTLFIIRQDYTPKGFLSIIHDYYAEGKINNISIVLNDIIKSGPGYGYGYGYNYGYGYGYSYGYGGKRNSYYEE